ncbi:MAG: asparagine synthase (glutamine-hydrolyzing) [Lachnospiraceae bacterium]|nr:asparagine synthase (glutamine-hydrolyzing) [Lachnospiraceae bacterium]
MCGIAGFCGNPKNWRENIERMNRRMYHRGPDAGGVWASADADVVLGHRRLAIVDLSENGAQPMHSASGRFVCVFNGEIYNHRRLRDKLLKEKKVTAFRGTSDTEVLVEAVEAYGVQETIRHCKGMFALALYDKKTGKLTLIRDRIGEKPLYYGFVNGYFVFASDIGSISALDDFDNPIDTKVLQLYFIHGYIPAPYSIYQDIYKLDAGCILELDVPYKEPKVSAYWSVREAAKYGQAHPFQGSRQEAADELERLLKASIREQMVADVPVGAFLSAGIDSSTVVALMQAQSNQKVKSFTIGMDDPAYNEAVYAKEIARHLGTEHTELYITAEDARAVIPRLSGIYGEPFADSSQIPTYLVSRMTREHVTVSLSGDGGDELFCGYGSYASIDRIWGKMKNCPCGVRRLASRLLVGNPLIRNNQLIQTKAYLLAAKSPEHLYELSNAQEASNLRIALEKETYPYKHNSFPYGALQDPKSSIMLMDMEVYHPDDILVKVDRSAMAVSLETRVPMLDKDVVEFAWTIPMAYKKQGGEGKLLLRDVLYRYVPKTMMERPKKGFSIPVAQWLREPGLREWAQALLDGSLIRRQGILDADAVERIWRDFIDNGNWRIQIWYILMFQSWMQDEAVRVSCGG